MIQVRLLEEYNFENCIEGILKLFRKCFTVPVHRKDLIWRYLKNPYEDVNAVIATDNEEIVGFIGTSPSRLKVNDTILKTVMIQNIMTHPNYCRQGIFSSMLTVLENELKRKGYEVMYSFPNFQSNHILVDHHGWTDVYEIPRLELQANCVKISQKETTIKINHDNNYDVEYKAFSHSFSLKAFIHDKEYRCWRIKNNPSGEYDNFVAYDNNQESVGYITIRKYNDEYNIVDFAFETIDQAEDMLCFGIKCFSEEKYRVMTAWCPINTKLHSLYEKQGFVNRYPITYFAVKVIGRNVRRDEIEKWSGWYIHAIDDNIY